LDGHLVLESLPTSLLSLVAVVAVLRMAAVAVLVDLELEQHL
jgi:hypothetical protein